MVDGADAERWSSLAEGWATDWGMLADPARRVLVDAAGIGDGTPVLDVGCGSGEFLALLESLGAVASGADPAPGMVERARVTAPSADIRQAGFDRLPWGDATFEVVTAVNSLQFAGDATAALGEAARVLAPGGRIAVANWAEDTLNDIETIEHAVARAAGEQPRLGGDYRKPGGLEAWFLSAGLAVVSSGLVATPWEAPDDDTLVRGILFGDDDATIAARSASVLTAAEPFRAVSGGYLLENVFRWVVGVPLTA